jgi:hypothetical protein
MMGEVWLVEGGKDGHAPSVPGNLPSHSSIHSVLKMGK